MGNGNSSGRGKRVNRVEQTLPLIMSGAKSRVTEKLAMSTLTSREVRAYVRWASRTAGIPEDEAMVLTSDRAFGDFFKRDELWQKQKSEIEEEGGAEVAPAPAGPTPPVRP